MTTRQSSFASSFLFLPAAKRRAITAVFDFCRAVDDAVDLAATEDVARSAVQLWRDEVQRVFSGDPSTPEGRALRPVAAAFRLPKDQFDALVDGVAMDVGPRQYQTFEELEPYCHRVASAVGLVCAEIFGYRNAATLNYAKDLGVALQLTNILRDVAVDHRRGRVYVPAEDLARFGCTTADIATAVDAGRLDDPKLRAVLEHQATRARVFFARVVRELSHEDRRAFLAAEIMRAIYWELLLRIGDAGYDVFRDVIRVPRAARGRIALRTWWAQR